MRRGRACSANDPRSSRKGCRSRHPRRNRAGSSLDPLVTARLLAKAVESEQPDLILTGLQSDDAGYGETGVLMADVLGYAHATIVVEVEAQAGSVRVKRELENGWFQHVSLPLPAVLT